MALINFSLKNEMVESATDVVGKRLNSSLYGTFIIFWSIFHWQLLYTAIFVSQDAIFEKTGLLKNEYLYVLFFNFESLYFYIAWAAPFLLTWLVIWKLPELLLLPAFEKEEQYRVEKENIKILAEKKIVNAETKLAVETEKKLAAVEKKTVRQKRIEKADPKVGWEKEYESFKASPHYGSFFRIVESIYQHGGAISWYPPNSSYKFFIPQDLLAYAHSHELIQISNENIKFTPKGLFFVAKLSEKNI